MRTEDDVQTELLSAPVVGERLIAQRLRCRGCCYLLCVHAWHRPSVAQWRGSRRRTASHLTGLARAYPLTSAQTGIVHAIILAFAAAGLVVLGNSSRLDTDYVSHRPPGMA